MSEMNFWSKYKYSEDWDELAQEAKSSNDRDWNLYVYRKAPRPATYFEVQEVDGQPKLVKVPYDKTTDGGVDEAVARGESMLLKNHPYR